MKGQPRGNARRLGGAEPPQTRDAVEVTGTKCVLYLTICRQFDAIFSFSQQRTAEFLTSSIVPRSTIPALVVALFPSTLGISPE